MVRLTIRRAHWASVWALLALSGCSSTRGGGGGSGGTATTGSMGGAGGATSSGAAMTGSTGGAGGATSSGAAMTGSTGGAGGASTSTSTASSGMPGCAPGETACGLACVDTSTSVAHCGACGVSCMPGQGCVAGACLTPPVCAGGIGFPGRPAVASPPGVVAVAVGDLNGDGKLDFALRDSGVAVLLGDGHGSAISGASYASVAVSASAPGDIAAVDMNGDGKLDLVVVGLGVSVMLGNGDGTFAAGVTYYPGLAFTKVAVGDVNGDGKPDLVLGNLPSNAATVMLGNGDGTLGSALNLSLLGTAPVARPAALALADIDGDGHVDIVTANEVSDTVCVILGHGDGTFAAPTTVPLSAGGSKVGLLAADLNGDGRIDLAVLSSTGSLDVRLNNGNGTFAASTRMLSGGRSLAKGDLNGDGPVDLVALDLSGRANMLKNQGDGTFVASVFGSYSTPWSIVAIADANGDGARDLLLVEPSRVALVLGKGDGTFVLPGDVGLGVVESAADLNGDGKPDLVIRRPGGQVSVLLGHGDGTFAPAIDYWSGNAGDLDVADVNGDGRPDLAIISGGQLHVSVLLNHGDGTFAAAIDYPTAMTGVGVTDVKIADVDGDGHPDLVSFVSSVGVGPATVSIALGAGDGTFGPPTGHAWAVGAEQTELRLIDLNADGRLDVVAMDAPPGVSLVHLDVMLNLGGGNFSPAASYLLGIDSAIYVLKDLNGDGRPDVVAVGGTIDNELEVLINHGDGTFSAPVTYALGDFYDPPALVAVDLNGDGSPDVAVASTVGGELTVFLNDGHGTLVKGETYPWSGGVLPGDLNGDGLVDLVAGDGSVALGHGDGTFAAALHYPAAYDITYPRLLDLNGDGRLDAIAGGVRLNLCLP